MNSNKVMVNEEEGRGRCGKNGRTPNTSFDQNKGITYDSISHIHSKSQLSFFLLSEVSR